MIACCSPADRFLEENLSTLAYATKAANISNKPIKNLDPCHCLISNLRLQVSRLTAELSEANNQIELLTKIVQENKLLNGSEKTEIPVEQTYENFQVEKEKIMSRLIESVTMMKEVLQENVRLRQENMLIQAQLDQYKTDLLHIQLECEELNEKMRIMSNCEEGRSPDDLGQISIPSPTVSYSPNQPVARYAIANELYQLKKDKNFLEIRLQDLERENIHMRATSNNFDLKESKKLKVNASDDFEPVRSVMNSTELISRVITNYSPRRKALNRRSVRTEIQTAEPSDVSKNTYSRLRNLFNPIPPILEQKTPSNIIPTQKLRDHLREIVSRKAAVKTPFSHSRRISFPLQYHRQSGQPSLTGFASQIPHTNRSVKEQRGHLQNAGKLSARNSIPSMILLDP